MLDAFAGSLDRSRAFMPEDARKPGGHDTGDDRVVGVTDAAGGHAHQDLAAFGLVEVNILHSHRLVELVTDRR
jgi:hypothetical protein